MTMYSDGIKIQQGNYEVRGMVSDNCVHHNLKVALQLQSAGTLQLLGNCNVMISDKPSIYVHTCRESSIAYKETSGILWTCLPTKVVAPAPHTKRAPRGGIPPSPIAPCSFDSSRGLVRASTQGSACACWSVAWARRATATRVARVGVRPVDAVPPSHRPNVWCQSP